MAQLPKKYAHLPQNLPSGALSGPPNGGGLKGAGKLRTSPRGLNLPAKFRYVNWRILLMGIVVVVASMFPSLSLEFGSFFPGFLATLVTDWLVVVGLRCGTAFKDASARWNGRWLGVFMWCMGMAFFPIYCVLIHMDVDVLSVVFGAVALAAGCLLLYKCLREKWLRGVDKKKAVVPFAVMSFFMAAFLWADMELLSKFNTIERSAALRESRRSEYPTLSYAGVRLGKDWRAFTDSVAVEREYGGVHYGDIVYYTGCPSGEFSVSSTADSTTDVSGQLVCSETQLDGLRFYACYFESEGKVGAIALYPGEKSVRPDTCLALYEEKYGEPELEFVGAESLAGECDSIYSWTYGSGTISIDGERILYHLPEIREKYVRRQESEQARRDSAAARELRQAAMDERRDSIKRHVMTLRDI